uniref:Casein kinase II subunit beta n=1 Tax=Chromera velia CCMP2878 TaxID=1169474 RepID=A0A0G4HW01_9ALVE|eukprot:Cvel_32417.t1-p1 / transcript=Cvel_32417.t1 / gene=Cvel_32417 / organism=Chromera_velia_CCMP2878 / gene_product=Casein kinase II subunit beta-3, putative / transcript_product=Casein kinase II subunit beta-3, putative / location=Cvel_scaffold5040:3967-6269(+) / protein_length=233 / sequence_SO=supercontig / SO=protein_coding / is_pseudo=false
MGSENDFDGSEDASESESQGSGTYSEISGSELDEEISWVEWFCNLKGNEYFVEVDEDYVQDDFNLTGLANIIPFFDHALNMILDIEDNDSDVAEPVPDEQYPLVESAAQMLYGMIHARYVLTTRGLQAMLEKYQACLYGQCPNVLCENQPMMPIGLSDNLRHSAAKVYCPRCQEVYQPRSSRLNTLDGAYFGTTLAPLFFMTYADTVPTTVRSYYVPRIYGFKVSSTVKDRLR